MAELYPEIEPHESGHLDVGDGHLLYWEVCGRPEGKPALVVHGGPGSGCTEGMRRLFDPEVYRIILFDQRNCGRSRPHGADPATDLSTNTTPHLLRDIEHLRRHLEVEKWLVYGGSWGSTLAIAYAEQHPSRVSEMVLAGVTTTRPADTDWLYCRVGQLFPAEWERFRAGAGFGAGEEVTGKDLVAAYYLLLNDRDPRVREQAARHWCDYEGAILSADPEHELPKRYLDARFRMVFARIVTHYFHHDAWLEDGVLLRNVRRLEGIPAVLVHGRLDLGTPIATAWHLSRVWRSSELIIAWDAGHETGRPSMRDGIIGATDRFAERWP